MISKKELQQWFSPLTKDELRRILDVFEQPHRDSAKKAELLDAVTSFIGGYPEQWLEMLTERDLRALKDCVDAGKLDSCRLKQPDYPCVPLFLHLMDKIAEDEDIVFIPPCIHALIDDRIDGIMKKKEADGSFERDRLVLGVLNIYGAIPLGKFIPLIRKCFKEKDAMEKLALIIDSPILKMCLADHGHTEGWLVSPYIFDLDGFVDSMSHFKKYRSYKKFSEKDFREIARNIPFCASGLESDEAKAVIRMFINLGLKQDEAIEELHFIWLDSQNCFEENMTAHIFEGVEEFAHDVSTFEEYISCLQTVADYANSIPKWYLKGRSANECDQMKITLHEKEDSENAFSELSKEMHFGMAVPHVSPYEPCPCGSGLSYRNCHGKFVN